MHLLAVNFHYFREEKPESGIYPLTIKEFTAQIDELSKYYKFISQGDLINKLNCSEEDNDHYCLLTFDDGLKEQMPIFNLLSQWGIPAVFYATTQPIREHKVVNVHKLHYIRSQKNDREVLKYISHFIDINSIQYPSNIEKLYRYDSLETKKLKYLLNFGIDASLKDEIINSLFLELIDEELYAHQLYMDESDLRILGKYGCLGSHTDSHLPLATQNEDTIRREISKSNDYLSSICGNPPPSISYPYGGPKAVSAKVASIAAETGFAYGLTMNRGINVFKDIDDVMLLKRIDTNDAPGGKFKSQEFCL